MNKKLIDWTTVPKGVMTNHGKLLGVDTINKDMASLYTGSYPLPFRHINFDELRLAPADEQPWLMYEEGVTVVPEWANIIYRFAASNLINAESSEAYIYEAKEKPENGDGIKIAYKLGSYAGAMLKAGWTDNPNEVIE